MAPPVVGVDDMCMLTNLTQETLLENTERRFKANVIYTFTGSILVSVNPYQPLPIYKVDDVNRYIGQQLGANPPHLFAIAEDSYANLRLHNRDQSILISGESGSGKTEATKLIMQYLAAMTRKKETQQDSVEMMILESSPILEAFGNAKTVRNNNSSRFGKFLEVCFDANGQIAGAKIVQYLLEKSRLVRQATDERNYHVFYALVYGSSDEEKAKYKLQPAEFYHYLNQSGCTSIKGINEKEELARLKTAFHYLGIDKTKQTKIFGILSAILLLGNVEFTDVSLVNNVEAHVKNTSLLNIIANLLDLRPDLLATALVKRKMTIKGQADTLIPLKSAEAAENRDAMSKALYGRLFTWLVNTINNKIQSKSSGTLRSIGILDIFGFENFPLNSFEQFCINYANEKLQGHFNQHIFSIEQQEYDKEGINWAKIEFKDNQDVLDLIEKRPVGLFSLLDEECRFPRATDMTLLQKLNSNHERNANYAKSRIGDSKQFGVNHYSGPVAYDVTGFLDKNKDTLQLLLLELCQSSKHEILAEMFAEEKEEGANKMTVGAQFKDQLANLMKNLSLTMPHYVRCVKPNSEKAPEKFDAELVLAQLRYSGMLETIRIRKLGYPVRFLFHDFIRRFKCLAPKTTGFNERETSMKVVQLCEKSFGLSDTYQMGKTKVFLRDLFYNKLETARTAAMAIMATVCKKTWKMHRVRKEYLRTKKSALFTQTLVRRLLDRKSYEKVEKAASYVQSFVRAYPDRKDFLILRGAAVTIQGAVHSDTARANYLNLQNATLMFQTLIRRRLAQSYKDYLIARRDRKSHLPPITASSSFSSLISPLSTPSPRSVSFRDPLRSVSHSADSDDSEAIGDRAGTPPAPETQRERRERRAEREREKEREKEEKKERERAEKLALTDRLSLPIGMSAVPLPPKKPESPFAPLRAPSPPRAFTKVYSAPSLGGVGATSSLQSTRSTIFSQQRKNTAAGPVPPPVFVHFPNLLPLQSSEDATPPSTPDLEEPTKGKDDKAGVIDSAKFPLSKYAAKLQPSIKGAPSTSTTILTYSSKASTQPLHKIPYGPLFKTALKASNNVMCYMGDQATHLAFNELATDIVGLGVDTLDLRDEIYCLILKQMNGNMNPASCLRGWELLAFCTGCFAPSADLLPYVSAFLTKCTGPKSTARERKFAEVCCTRLTKIASVGPRKRPPSVSEMEAIKMHRKVNVTIFLPTGKTMVLRVESTTTASAMCKRMCKKLHLDSNAKWAFFETYNELERKLQPKEFMLDIVFKWEFYVRLMEGTDSESCRFVFKRVHVGDRCECASRSDSRFVYDQAVAEVMSGHQPVTEIEAVRLAALSFEHDLRSGVPAPADWAKAYIPPELIQYRKSQEWLDIITIELEKVRASVDKKATATALENQYMEYVSSLPMYGSSIFYVALKASSHEYLPTSFYLCVNVNGIHFISTDMVLHTIPFSQFVSVNLEGHTLSIVATKDAQDGEEKKPKKETFRLVTYQGDDIRAAIDNVVATLNPKLKKTKSTSTAKTIATPAKTSTLQKAATTSNVGKTATVTTTGLQKAASTTTKKTTTTKKLKSENKLVSVLSV